MCALAVLRITYSLRSSESCTITSWPRPMNTWRMTGSLARTVGDIGMSRFTGTSRHPSSTWPSALMARSSSSSQARREACSLGRKTMPTPYSPGGGSLTPLDPSGAVPARAISARYSASGIWIRMPAPSPISASAPTAPRWSRFSRIFSALVMMAWLFSPFRCATKPTPQASCSWAGSYRPCCCNCCCSARVLIALFHPSDQFRKREHSALQHRRQVL